MKEMQFEYDVALSFAEEDKRFVDCVAAHLRDNGIKYYYYGHDDPVKSWGKELTEYLDGIYREKSRYCVVFISKHYKRKSWTNYERKVLQERAVKDVNDYILPFRMDNTDIPGIPLTIKDLSYEKLDCRGLAQAIIQKINGNEEIPDTELKRHFSRQTETKVRRWRGQSFKRIGELYVPDKILWFFSGRIRRVMLSVAAAGTFAAIFRDNLTPVEMLADRIHEQSKFRPVFCRDGTISRSSGGRGTCSHHGGVHHISDTMIYDKTIQQCREEAAKISWLGQ